MIVFAIIALAIAGISWALVHGGTNGEPLSRRDTACMIVCYAIVYVPLIVIFWP